jgi:hypothetical protein
MKEKIAREHWALALAEINAANVNWPTSLEVIGPIGEVSRDYWLENGLPLLGLSLEKGKVETLNLAILLGGQTAREHLEHNVTDVVALALERDYEGHCYCLEVEDAAGRVTILRFALYGTAAAAV